MYAHETFKFNHSGIDFTVAVIGYDSNDGFSDQWEMTDDHKGGVTIANPNSGRNSYKYGIPQQTTLAELTASYAKQGRENPSREAYDSLQSQLERDIDAGDYGFQVTAYAGTVLLLDGETLGCGFDHSPQDEDSLLSTAREVWDDHGIQEEAIEAAKAAAGEILNNMDSLKNIVDAA